MDRYELEAMSDNELRSYIRLHKSISDREARLADFAFAVLVARSAAAGLQEAAAVQRKAIEGTCTNGVLPCPVHQMGGCAERKEERNVHL